MPFPRFTISTIINSPEDHVIDNVKKLMQEYHIGKKTIADLNEKISDPVKKEIITSWNRPIPKNN